MGRYLKKKNTKKPKKKKTQLINESANQNPALLGLTECDLFVRTYNSLLIKYDTEMSQRPVTLPTVTTGPLGG